MALSKGAVPVVCVVVTNTGGQPKTSHFPQRRDKGSHPRSALRVTVGLLGKGESKLVSLALEQGAQG